MSDLMKIVLVLSVSGTVLAAVLALLRRCLKNKLPHGLFYYLWLLVLLRLMVPVALPVPGLERVMEPPAVEIIAPPPVQATPDDGVQQPIVIAPGNPQTVPNQTVPGASGQPVPVETPESPWYDQAWDFLCENFTALWLTGAAVHFLWFALSYLRFCRSLRADCTPLWEHEQALLDDLRGDIRVEACRSPQAQTPMLVGLLRPRIILPRQDISTLQLECILRHELTHLRRRDLLYKWFAVAVTSFHWFNPLMPWLRKEISRCCELSCDEAVIEPMNDDQKRTYGETLLALAAANALPRAVPATTLCEEKKQLKERLVGILKHKHATAVILLLSCLLALLVAGCAAVLGPQTQKKQFTGPLTEEQQAPVMEHIRAWADENLEADGELSLTYSRPDRPQGMGWATMYADGCWLYDLHAGEIKTVDGTYPDTAQLGMMLAQGQEAGKNRLWAFYLTNGDPEEAADPIQGLRQVAADYPDGKVGSLSWWRQEGKGIFMSMDFVSGDKGYTCEYSSVCGVLDVTPNEQALARVSPLPLEGVPGLLDNIIRWQAEQDTPHNGQNYSLNLAVDNRLVEILVDSHAQVAVHNLSTGEMARLEGDYTGCLDYGCITVLGPAQSPFWLYLIDDTVKPFVPQQSGQVAVVLEDTMTPYLEGASSGGEPQKKQLELKRGTLVYVQKHDGSTCEVTVLTSQRDTTVDTALLSVNIADLKQANQVILNDTPIYDAAGGENLLGSYSGVVGAGLRNGPWWKVYLESTDGVWIKEEDLVYQWPLPVSTADLAGKIFRYEEEGFGSDFTIKLHAGGTFGYYEGMLSSHIGMGTWAVEGDILTLHEDTFNWTFRFRVQDGALRFLREGSNQFMYIKVADGARFLESALPDAVYENLRLGFRMTFPASWGDDFQIEEQENSVEIEASWGGTLCTILRRDAAAFGEALIPVPYRVLGQNGQYVWLMYFASDVQYDPSNAEQTAAYLRMYEGLQSVPFELTVSGQSAFQTYDTDGDGQLSAREFPRPTGETMGLTGKEATLYTVLSENILDLAYPAEADFGNALVLTSVNLIGAYDGENGQIHYVCGINDSHFYDAGDDPATLSYHTMGSQGLLARVTLSAKGELAAFYPTLQGADNAQRTKEIFGPLSEQYAAWAANQEIPGAYRLVPTGEELLELYKSTYFPINK